jgi:hypothetical protein
MARRASLCLLLPLALVLTACPDDDCARKLTCPPSGDGGASGAGGGVDGGGGAGGGELKPNGVGCGSDAECASDLCVDSVCCESSCDGSCEACDVEGSEGSCVLHEPATDPEGECAPGLCNGFGACARGAQDWLVEISGDLGPIDLAVDSSGAAVIAAVSCCGSITVGASTVVGPANSAFYVVKLDAAGGVAWSRAYPASPTDYLGDVAVAVDAADNITVVGFTDEATNFGGSAIGSSDVFAAQLGPDGSHEWSRGFPFTPDGFLSPDIQGVTTDPSGAIYAVGRLDGTLSICNKSLASAANGLFAFKLDSAGSCQWAFDWEANANFGGLAAAASGFYVTGSFQQGLDFGGNTLTTLAGDVDMFLARLDAANGMHGWSKQFGDDAAQDGTGVAITTTGELIVSGTAEGGIDFGGQVLQGTDNADIVLARFTSAGAHTWSARHGDLSDQTVEAVAAGPHDEICLAGDSTGTLDLGTASLSVPSLRPITAALSAAGDGLWAHATEGLKLTGVSDEAIGVDPDGNVFTLSRVANGRAFVAKRGP